METRVGARAGGVLLAIALGAMATNAHAQLPRDPVTAEALFVDGKRLMQAHDYANACPKLAESQRLDPSGGTVFALALCYEGAGKLATAWATFNEALADARRSQRPDREAAAAEHVHTLEGRLTRLRIDVPHPVPDLEVTRNGIPVGKVLWSTPVPIDPGTYTFEAHAPGRVPWKWSVNIDRPGGLFNFPVPELAPVPVVAPPADAAKPAAKKSYLLPEVTFAVAGGTLLIGSVMGIVSGVAWKNAESTMGPARVNAGQTAGTEADVSTTFFVVGGVAAVAGGIMVAVIHSSDSDAPKDEARPAPHAGLRLVPMVGPGGFGLSLGGSL